MKQSLYDEALSGIGEIVEQVSDSIAKEFKGTIPFDKTLATKDDLMAQFNNLNPEEKMAIFQQIQGGQM